MSVLINNMKMPKNCLDCPMINDEDWCVLQETPINDSDVPSTWEELKEGCPLEERPEGHWIKRSHILYCSECGKSAVYGGNFCPTCGADMRERADD